MKLLSATRCCRQKFHRVYVRETCFKRFLEFHEIVSSNRTLLYFLKLVSYFARQLANHSSAVSEGQFTCNFYKCVYTIKKGVIWWALYTFLRWIQTSYYSRSIQMLRCKCNDHQTQWDNKFVLPSMLSEHNVEKVCTILARKSNR